jgi:hypothetical protein
MMGKKIKSTRLRIVCVNQRGKRERCSRAETNLAFGNLEIKVRVGIKKSWGSDGDSCWAAAKFSFLRARKISRNQPAQDRTQIPLLF